MSAPRLGLQSPPLTHQQLLNLAAADFIKTRRKQLGLTQTDVAKALGITQAELSTIEKGRANLTLTNSVRFTKRYASEIKMDFLKEGKDIYVNFSHFSIPKNFFHPFPSLSFREPASSNSLSSSSCLLVKFFGVFTITWTTSSPRP